MSTSQDRVTACYLVETCWSLEEAAEALAGEQSSGTFVEVPGETPELRAHYRARVDRISDVEDVQAPSLPGSRPPRASSGEPRYRRAEIEVSWPLENIGVSLPLSSRRCRETSTSSRSFRV